MRKSVQPICEHFQKYQNPWLIHWHQLICFFFSFIASHVVLFLVKYQTDQPMIPFIYDDLTSICPDQSFIFQEPIENQEKPTSKKIQRLKKYDEVSLHSVRVFKKGCRLFVTFMLNKIFEKCPLGSKILSFVHPFAPGYKCSWIKYEETVKVAKSCN